MTLYEDRLVTAELAPEAAAKGHILVRPRREARHLSELSEEESAHLFTVASYAAAILFQGLQAEGTNILCTEEEAQLTLHVIARRQGDGLDFQWEPGEVEEAAMADARERIREKAYAPAAEPAAESAAAPAAERLHDEEEQENQLIKQLLRVP